MTTSQDSSAAVDSSAEIGGAPRSDLQGRRLLTSSAGQQLGLVGVILALAILTTANNSLFTSVDNLTQILLGCSVYFVAACPATLVVISGGLDISVGAAVPVGGVIAGMLMADGVHWGAACLVALVGGVSLGLVNGLVIRYLKVPPIIATLGMFFTAGGLATAMTAGEVFYDFPDAFTRFGQESLGPVPYLVFFAVLVGVVFHVLLEHTRFGFDTKAIGGNELAAKSNGIRVNRVIVLLYALSGFVGAFGGLMLASRLSAASSDIGGAGFTFQIITAVIIGGTSLFGGEGNIFGTALGALLFSVIDSSLALLQIPTLYQNVAVGVILVLAVAIDQLRRSREFQRR